MDTSVEEYIAEPKVMPTVICADSAAAAPVQQTARSAAHDFYCNSGRRRVKGVIGRG